MSEIMTVLGPIQPDEVGFTTMHEHILINGQCVVKEDNFDQMVIDHFDGKLPHDPETITLENLNFIRRGGFAVSDFCWDLSDVQLMKEEVGDFKKVGGSTIFEVSTVGLRTEVEGLREISRDTGVNIVTCTGFYDEVAWPDFVFDMSIEDMVAYIKRDVEDGFEGTDIRAGGIKTGANDFTDNAVKNLTACARAAIETGLCLTVHNGIRIDKDASWEMLRVLLGEGLDPERIIWAHTQNFVNETEIVKVAQTPESYYLNLDFAKRVLDKGVTVSVDCFGNQCDMEFLGSWDRDDKIMLGMVAKLLQDGYSSQIVLGHDVSWRPFLARYGGDGYNRVSEFVIPTLEKAGYSAQALERMTTGNPARLLTRNP